MWLRSDEQANYVQNIDYLNSLPGEMRPMLKEKDPMRDKRITYDWLESKGQEEHRITYIGSST